MLKYCTHKMRAFFQGIEIQEKRGGSTLNRWLCRSRPPSHSGLCKTRRKTWIFCFFSYYGFIILSPLAVVWYYKQLEAHRKYNFMWNKKLLAFSPLILFHGGHSCTFVSCNCVNVLIFIKWPLIHWQPRLLWRYSVEAFLSIAPFWCYKSTNSFLYTTCTHLCLKSRWKYSSVMLIVWKTVGNMTSKWNLTGN